MAKITWLDLIAANTLGFAAIFAFLACVYWVRTERKKAFPIFLMVVIGALVWGNVIWRAAFWYEQPTIIVPPVASQ
jgi:hypothetical protein